MTRRHPTPPHFTGKSRFLASFRALHVTLGLCFSCAGITGAFAQEGDPVDVAGKPSWLITPSVATNFTLTDNVRPGQGEQKSDFITSVTPAIRVIGKGGRVSGNLAFSWQQSLYANESAFNNDQKSLVASGKAELIEQWLFLDANGNIAQRPNSVFGTQSVGNELVNSNRSETTSYQWSPYIQGRLGGSADYELRYRNSRSTSDTGVFSTASGVDVQTWNGRLSGATPFSFLGWSVNAENQRVEFGSTTDTKSSRLLGALEYRIDPQVKLHVSAGRESDNYSSVDLQSRTTSGYGIDWAPTERSLLAIRKERRGFGDSHSIDFSHRTALTAWKLSDSRSITLPAQQLTTAQVSTAYDLLYQLLSTDFPDPDGRAQEALRRLSVFRIPADSPVFGDVLSSQPFIQRRQLASVAFTGANNTVTLAAQRSHNERIGTGAGLAGQDLFNTSNIRQTGLSASWAHKLSPQSSLTLNALTSRSKGDLSNQDSRLRSWSLLFSTRLGVRTTASLGLRQNNFDNTTGVDYDENAIIGTLSASF